MPVFLLKSTNRHCTIQYSCDPLMSKTLNVYSFQLTCLILREHCLPPLDTTLCISEVALQVLLGSFVRGCNGSIRAYVDKDCYRIYVVLFFCDIKEKFSERKFLKYGLLEVFFNRSLSLEMYILSISPYYVQTVVLGRRGAPISNIFKG